MESPVQDIIIGNVSGALGAETRINTDKNENTNIDSNAPQTHDNVTTNMTEQTDNNVNDYTVTNNNTANEAGDQTIDTSETHDHCAVVQTRAMVAKEGKPPKPLQVKSVPGLDIGPDELLAAQKADKTITKYWDLIDKTTDQGKPQFLVKKGILYRKYFGKQDRTGFTPFELIYGHKVRTPMTLLKRIWTNEDEDPEMKTAYQHVIDLRQRVEETCELAKKELAKVQTRNQNYYNRKTRQRKLQVGDSILLLLPTEHNKLTLAWRGPYKVVGVVGEVDYRIEIDSGKVKTYHINMLKRYHHRDGNKPDKTRNDDDIGEQEQVHQRRWLVC